MLVETELRLISEIFLRFALKLTLFNVFLYTDFLLFYDSMYARDLYRAFMCLLFTLVLNVTEKYGEVMLFKNIIY